MIRPLTDDERTCVEANMGLVYQFCERYRRDSRYEDLQAAAFTGLCYAVQQYDPEIAQLSTYAWRWMASEVQEEMSRLRMIRISPKHFCNNVETLYLPETIAAIERARNACKIEWSDDEAAAVLAVDEGKEFRDYTELHQHIDALSERDRCIITEMFMHQKTQQFVGDKLGVTKERARQLGLRAIHKLRRRLDRLEKAGAL